MQERTTVTACPGDRAAEEPLVCVAGPVFLDVTMSGLDHAPQPGQRQWASDCSLTPGGAADQAVALSRLGVPVSLVCYLGTDSAGILVEHLLHEEQVLLSDTVQVSRQPVATSLTLDGSRTTTSFGSTDPPPLFLVKTAPPVLATDLQAIETDRGTVSTWRAAPRPTWVVADVSQPSPGSRDPRDLDPLEDADAFTPNRAEALGYTRASDPRHAARLLARRVHTVVVTCGGEGVVAVDPTQEVVLPAPRAATVDPTGAGKVLTAGLIWGHTHDLDLRQSLTFACLAASMSTTRSGGAAAAAPTLSQVAHRARQESLPKGYDPAFLDLVSDLVDHTGPPDSLGSTTTVEPARAALRLP